MKTALGLVAMARRILGQRPAFDEHVATVQAKLAEERQARERESAKEPREAHS